MKLLKMMLLNVLVLNLGLSSIQAMDDVGAVGVRRPTTGYQKLAMTALLLAAADLAARRGDSLPVRGAKNLQKLGSWLWNGSEKGRWADALTHLKRNKGKYITAALAALVAIGTKRGRRAVQLARGWSDARAPWRRALLNPLEAARFGFAARKYKNLDTCWLDAKPGFARDHEGVFEWKAPVVGATIIGTPADLSGLAVGTKVYIAGIGRRYRLAKKDLTRQECELADDSGNSFRVNLSTGEWCRWARFKRRFVLDEGSNPFPRPRVTKTGPTAREAPAAKIVLPAFAGFDRLSLDEIRGKQITINGVAYAVTHRNTHDHDWFDCSCSCNKKFSINICTGRVDVCGSGIDWVVAGRVSGSPLVFTPEPELSAENSLRGHKCFLMKR